MNRSLINALRPVLFLLPMFTAPEGFVNTTLGQSPHFIELRTPVRAVIVDCRFWEPRTPRWKSIEELGLSFYGESLSWKLDGRPFSRTAFAPTTPGDSTCERRGYEVVETEDNGTCKTAWCERCRLTRKLVQYGDAGNTSSARNEFCEVNGCRCLEVAVVFENFGIKLEEYVLSSGPCSRLDANIVLLDGQKIFPRDFLLPGVAVSEPREFRSLEETQFTMISQLALSKGGEISCELKPQEKTWALLLFDIPQRVNWARFQINGSEPLPLDLTRNSSSSEPVEQDVVALPLVETDVIPNEPPEDADRACDRAENYWRFMELDKAIAEYKNAIDLDGQCAQAYLFRGLAYRMCGCLNEAVKDYSMAIRLGGPGVAFLHKGTVDGRRSDFGSAAAYLHRGVVYAKKGHLDRAIRDYSEAILRDPNSDVAYRNRALAYKAKGEKAKAEADFAKAEEAWIAICALSLEEEWPHDLAELAEERFVRVTVSGSSITQVYAQIESLIPQTLSKVVVPRGTAFVSEGSYQDMVTTRDHQFVLPGHGTIVHRIPTSCLDPEKSIPKAGDYFSKVKKAPERVAAFLMALRMLEDAPPKEFVTALESLDPDPFLIALRRMEEEIPEDVLMALKSLGKYPPEELRETWREARLTDFIATLESLKEVPAEEFLRSSSGRLAKFLTALKPEEKERLADVLKVLKALEQVSAEEFMLILKSVEEAPPVELLEALKSQKTGSSQFFEKLAEYLRGFYVREKYLRDPMVVQAAIWAITDDYTGQLVKERLTLVFENEQTEPVIANRETKPAITDGHLVVAKAILDQLNIPNRLVQTRKTTEKAATVIDYGVE